MNRIKLFFTCIGFIIIGLILFLLYNQNTKQASSNIQEKKSIKIVTTLFPIYDFTLNVGYGSSIPLKENNPHLTVSMLIPPGTDIHSYSPSPLDINNIFSADLFFYCGNGLEPWIEKLLPMLKEKGVTAVDIGEGLGENTGIKCACGSHHHNHLDPHIWMSPILAQTMVNRISKMLCTKDPTNQVIYLQNAKNYNQLLAGLDQEFTKGLSPYKNRTIIHGGHNAIGHLAQKYNLQIISPYNGWTSNEMPSPQSLNEVISAVKKHHVKFIFHEELLNPKLAQTIANETGTQLCLLHGIHNLSSQELKDHVSYLELMKKNLESLKKGLQAAQEKSNDQN